MTKLRKRITRKIIAYFICVHCKKEFPNPNSQPQKKYCKDCEILIEKAYSIDYQRRKRILGFRSLHKAGVVANV